jgi:threonine synthase
MKYYSTNRKSPSVGLQEAVIKGLAPDGGLYMPEQIPTLPETFFAEIDKKSFKEIAFNVALALLHEDIEEDVLQKIVRETLNFDTPLVQVKRNIYSLELFHGPTLAFKDVGARFMARLLSYFIRNKGMAKVNVLVATSGDTGSAVANGFLGVDGIRVFVLYPNKKVSKIQEKQFTTLGQNIAPISIAGTFDDCQRLVKMAFTDEDLTQNLLLTSANSINIARLLPQTFYYFYAYAQLARLGLRDNIVVSVPSGNLGNLTAGLIAHRMGLPIKHFIAANNSNDVFFNYLQTGKYDPQPSIQTVANAMDVGAPSNIARILDLFDCDHSRISTLISGCRCSDDKIRQTMIACKYEYEYLTDPHGACGYYALRQCIDDEEIGIFLETAHPAKFNDMVFQMFGESPDIPYRLLRFMRGRKKTYHLKNDFEEFKRFLLQFEEK